MSLFRKIATFLMFGRTDIVVWKHCNIYGGTRIGKGCRIGAYTEISGAVIGDNVTIAAKCFIPKKVTIEDNVFIGPGVYFTHSFPPAREQDWRPILIKRGVMIGSNVTIKEGVTIGANARIGCGSVVTKSVPDGATWCGNPAAPIKTKP